LAARLEQAHTYSETLKAQNALHLYQR